MDPRSSSNLKQDIFPMIPNEDHLNAHKRRDSELKFLRDYVTQYLVGSLLESPFANKETILEDAIADAKEFIMLMREVDDEK